MICWIDETFDVDEVNQHNTRRHHKSNATSHNNDHIERFEVLVNVEVLKAQVYRQNIKQNQ